MKKIGIVLFVILTVALILFSNSMVYAFDVTNLTGKNSGQEDKINNFGQGIIKILATVGSILSVIVLVIIGIKYMLGSVEERAEYKKTLLPYVIGAVFVFGASNIASVIYNIAIKL